MGFDGILHLKGKRLRRSLRCWIMTMFDPINIVLMLSGGIDYPLGRAKCIGFWESRMDRRGCLWWHAMKSHTGQ